MAPSARLGGFKILKDVVRISPVFSSGDPSFPGGLFQVIAEKKINLPFVTCLHEDGLWGFHLAVDASESFRASKVINQNFGQIFSQSSNCAILSVFPHKRDPEIIGLLFEIFDPGVLDPDALANSPSAISIILKEECLSTASRALFAPFSFSAYRTPADWKLAQKGKEKRYKEVIASYQERRPKVYGLEVHENQAFVRIILRGGDLPQMGIFFKELARSQVNLTFIATCPCPVKGNDLLAFCVPESSEKTYTRIMNGIAPGIKTACTSAVSVFSMNGPHFGDRYGIAKELLMAFEPAQIDLLGLSCTIASVTGVVSSDQMESATRTIQSCFEVPSIRKVVE
jgi:hypothetical protein